MNPGARVATANRVREFGDAFVVEIMVPEHADDRRVVEVIPIDAPGPIGQVARDENHVSRDGQRRERTKFEKDVAVNAQSHVGVCVGERG